ncbi:hypothetical protein [Streptomyces phaeochromogenes]|uniref:hypothetical protein n=1 Tax=Streptomyces phaeochromogenes TaxID=1923 RepID=UPI0033E708A3
MPTGEPGESPLPDTTTPDSELGVWEAGWLAFERPQGWPQRPGATAARARPRVAAHFVAFGILQRAGTNTVASPYRRRRAALEELFSDISRRGRGRCVR